MVPGKRNTAEQIVDVLRQIEVAIANSRATPLTLKAGVTEQTFYSQIREWPALHSRVHD